MAINIISKISLLQPVQTVIYMYTLHSNQVKHQKHSLGFSQRSHAKRRDETLLTAFRFIKLNQGNREGYKPQRQKPMTVPKGPTRRKMPWIKPSLPGVASD